MPRKAKRLTWSQFYSDVLMTLRWMRVFPSSFVFYRGHREFGWGLKPRIVREFPLGGELRGVEEGLYFRFVNEGGELVAKSSDWQILAMMQQYRLPTRFLDWSTSFGVALYFAVGEAEVGVTESKDAAIWMLNPYKLNGMWKNPALVDPTELGCEYMDFLGRKKSPKTLKRAIDRLSRGTVALMPERRDPRLVGQAAGFTFHGNLGKTLNPTVVGRRTLARLRLPAHLFEAAREFLYLAGIDRFSLFPDLEGLSKKILAEEKRTHNA